MSVTIQILTPTNRIIFAHTHTYTKGFYNAAKLQFSLDTCGSPPEEKRKRERENVAFDTAIKKGGLFSPSLNSLHYLSSSSSFSLPPQDRLKEKAERIKWSAVPLRKESWDSLQWSPRQGPCPRIRGQLRGSAPWGCERPRSCLQIGARWYDNRVMLCHWWYIAFSAKTARSD